MLDTVDTLDTGFKINMLRHVFVSNALDTNWTREKNAHFLTGHKSPKIGHRKAIFGHKKG